MKGKELNRPLSISIVVVTIFSAGMLAGAYFYQWAGQSGVRLVADGGFESQVLFKSYEYAILHRVAMNDSLAASSTDEIALREARAGIGQIEIFRKALNDYKRPVVGLEAQVY